MVPIIGRVAIGGVFQYVALVGVVARQFPTQKSVPYLIRNQSYLASTRAKVGERGIF